MLRYVLNVGSAFIGISIGLFDNMIMWTWLRPIMAAQAVSLFFSLSWLNVIALIVIFVGDMVINGILVNLYDYNICSRIANTYFCSFPNSHFQPVKFDQLLRTMPGNSSKLSPQTLFRRMSLVRLFYVYTSSGKRPSTHTTYQLLGTNSLVFLNQHPTRMKPMARFFLLHELGHANVMHLFFTNQAYFATVYLVLLIINLLIRPAFVPSVIVVSCGMLALWITYILTRSSPGEELVELTADSLALMFFAGDGSFIRTIATIAYGFHKQGRQIPFLRIRARALIRQAQIVKHAISAKKKLDVNQWESFIAYTRSTHPSKFISIPLAVGVVYIGSKIAVSNLLILAILLVAWVIIPAIVYHFVVMPWIVKKRLGLINFMIQRSVPKEGSQEGIEVTDFL